MGTIYILIDPVTEEIRYVGWTTKALNVRLRGHINCKHGLHRASWISGLLRRGLRPRIQTVQQVPTTVWERAERYWISYFKGIGCPLTNGAAGGEGASGHKVSAATRLKIGSHHRGKTISDEHKRAVGTAAKLKWDQWRASGSSTSEETRQRISVANKGHIHSESARSRMSAAHKGKPKSPEHRERIRQALLGRTQTAAHREKTAANALKANRIRWGKEA